MSSWSSGKRTERLACKIKFLEMRSTETWGGERGSGGRCIEDYRFVLFTKPSLALWGLALYILGAHEQPGSSQGKLSFCAFSPSPRLSSPIQIPTSILWCPISFHTFYPHAKVCEDILYSTRSLTPPFPFSSFSFATSNLHTAAQKWAKASEETRTLWHPEDIFVSAPVVETHDWERVNMWGGFQPWHPGAWKCWGGSKKLHK